MNVPAIYNPSPRRDSSWLSDSNTANNQFFSNYLTENAALSTPMKPPNRHLSLTVPQAQKPKPNHVAMFDPFPSPFSSGRSSQLTAGVYEEQFPSSYEPQNSCVDEDFDLQQSQDSFYSSVPNGYQPQPQVNIIYAPQIVPAGAAFTQLNVPADPACLPDESQQSPWINLAANAAASLFNNTFVMTPVNPTAFRGPSTMPFFYTDGLSQGKTNEEGFKPYSAKNKINGLDSNDSAMYSQIGDFSGYNLTPSQFLSNGFLCSSTTPVSYSDNLFGTNNESESEEMIETVQPNNSRKRVPDPYSGRNNGDDDFHFPTSRTGRKARRKDMAISVNTKKSKVKKAESPVIKRYNRKFITETWVRKTNAIESPFEPVGDLEYDEQLFEDGFSPTSTGSIFSATEPVTIHDTPLPGVSTRPKSSKSRQSKASRDVESDIDDLETAVSYSETYSKPSRVSSLGKLTAVSNMLLKRLSDTGVESFAPPSSGTNPSGTSSWNSSPAPSTIEGSEDAGTLVEPLQGGSIKKPAAKKGGKAETLKDQIQESLDEPANLKWTVESSENGKLTKTFVIDNLDDWKCTWCLIPKKDVPALRRGPLGLK
ncbi:hypothetical protein HK098_005192, partial [Nowakowskiella sp. JEL0407]